MKIVQKVINGIKTFENRAKDIDPPITSEKCNKKDEATLVLGKHKQKVSLKTIRCLLVFINLVILLASLVSFSAWRAAKYDWKGTDVDQHLLLDPLKDLPAMPYNEERVIQAVHSCLDQILYLTALNLFLYWIIYGVVVSVRFGGACEVWTLVMSLPHTAMIIIWEVGVAVSVLRVIYIMTSPPWHNMELDTAHHHTYIAANHVHRFYEIWGPWLAACYLSAVPVQVFTVVIPFFLTEMPYQRDPEIGNQESDYVDKEQLDTISGARRFSMYKCQLPAEKLDELDSIQAMRKPLTRIRKLSVSLKNGTESAGMAVIHAMNSVYHVHHSQAPVWTILENQTPHPKLTGAQTLAGGVSIFPEGDNYMDMRGPYYNDHMNLSDIHLQRPGIPNGTRDLQDPPNMKLYSQ